MSGSIEFDYYYGIEAEQFSFYRVPRILIKDERFRGLSSDAKLLYGLMLDRMSLSMKNGWFDGQNRAYIYYTLENAMEDLGCCRDKCVKVFAELDSRKGIGLIEKKRQGLGKPDIIYVKNFAMMETGNNQEGTDGEPEMPEMRGDADSAPIPGQLGDIPVAGKHSQTGNGVSSGQTKNDCTAVILSRTGNDTSVNPCQKEEPFSSVPEQGVIYFGRGVVKRAEDFVDKEVYEQLLRCASAPREAVETDILDAEKQICRSRENGLAEVGKTDLQKSEKQTSGNLKNRLLEVGETDLQESENQTCRSRKNGLAEVGKSDTNYTEGRYTEKNDTNISHTDLNDIEKSNTEWNHTDAGYTDLNKKEIDYTGMCNINPINQSYQSVPQSLHPSYRESVCSDGREQGLAGRMAEVEGYMKLIKENIEYDHFMQYGDMTDKELFDNLYGVICSVVCADCETVRISGASYPHEMVKSKFLKLKRGHIEYVMHCLNKNTSAVHNINEYLKTSLFNATNTIDGYYHQAVRHDMYGGGWAESGIV